MIGGLVALSAAAALSPQLCLLSTALSTRLGIHKSTRSPHWLFAGNGNAYFVTAALAIFGCVTSR